MEEEIVSPDATPNVVHTDPWDIDHREQELLNHDIEQLREMLLKKEKLKLETDRKSVASDTSEIICKRRRRNSWTGTEVSNNDHGQKPSE